ncbi:MAG: signal peptidase I [Euryarchaeota archaeon RBG_13_31_8]|nr:MAG: signal peptidase I [Euryarchaeota archaeon RBG_13_31_8]
MVSTDGFKVQFAKFKLKFMKFWRSEDSKISLVRDVLVAFFLVFIILLALWVYTGQWFGAPMVAIESGSMMHPDEPFGRIGTIDAGDMVFLVKVNSKADVVSNAIKDPNNVQYWNNGDVIIYRPYGDYERDQIIHRAMVWVDYNEKYKTYTVEGYEETNTNVTSITIPELNLNRFIPKNPHSGFITKGDNPYTNPTTDQEGGICDELIRVEWISGKARGELPWIGTLNLIFNDIVGGKSTLQNVPGDSITCLIILIVVLVSIPISLDVYGYFKEKKEEEL